MDWTFVSPKKNNKKPSHQREQSQEKPRVSAKLQKAKEEAIRCHLETSMCCDGDSSRESDVNIDVVIARIQRLVTIMESLPVLTRTETLLTNDLGQMTDIVSIVALGLGDICNSVAAMIQFAYIICLRKKLASASDDTTRTDIANKVPVQIFEPLFNENTHGSVCRHFDVDMTPNNCYGRYDVPQLRNGRVGDTESSGGDRGTVNDGDNPRYLFFMPHCPHSLYCNVLWTHWEKLDSIIIIGNR
jgi:hypothetical protein